MIVYGFDENKNKHEIFSKNCFAILKSEYFFKTNTEITQKNEVITHYLKFPNETWTVENTRILEARTTYYNKKSNGAIFRGMTKLVGDSQITYSNGNFFASDTEAKVTITPNGKTGTNKEADIFYEHEDWGTVGDKEVFEVLLMKIDVEDV